MEESTSAPTTQERSSVLDVQRFFSCYLKSHGGVAVLLISAAVSVGIGCTVALVPELLTDRYARLFHGYEGDLSCSSYTADTMPYECRLGADNAQNASAWSSVWQYLLTFFGNAMVGRLSDVHGRRPLFCLCIFLNTLAPLALVWMINCPSIHPVVYYGTNAVTGLVSYMSITLAILCDVLPVEFRAPGFGVILAAFFGGFAFSPYMALIMSALQVSVVAAALVTLAFVYTILYFPETLPGDVKARNQALVEAENDDQHWFVQGISRPFRDMAILKRDRVIQLVAGGTFFSSMVYAADVKLVVFYIEEHLNVRENDIAPMFLIMGIVGVAIQALFLQSLLAWLGERRILIVSFVSGTLHNLLYGVATNKQTILIALCMAQLSKTDAPILASVASKRATRNEQGQLQGALNAVGALGGAIGPVTMQFIYARTENSMGPGTMWIFAAFFYSIGTMIVSFLKEEPPVEEPDSDLEEPLLEESNLS